MTQHTIEATHSHLLEQVNYEKEAIASGLAECYGDILVLPFWKPSFCKLVIEAAEEHGGFEPLPDDLLNNVAPGRELRIRNFSQWLENQYIDHWLTHLKKPVEEFYRSDIFKDRTSFRAPFILKYTMDGQRSMAEHHDFSLLSVSVRLNSEHTGSELVFPRQNWWNKEVPTGHAVIFPGLLTHPHYASELTSGVRYGLTGWIRAPKIDRLDTL